MTPWKTGQRRMLSHLVEAYGGALGQTDSNWLGRDDTVAGLAGAKSCEGETSSEPWSAASCGGGRPGL